MPKMLFHFLAKLYWGVLLYPQESCTAMAMFTMCIIKYILAIKIAPIAQWINEQVMAR